MTLAALEDISWLAVIVGTLAYYLLGAIWFSPAFGRQWDKALGFSRPERWRPGTLYYLAPLLGCLASTIATAILVQATGVQSMGGAVSLGLVVGIGYSAAVSAVNAITPNTPRPILYGAVTGGYHTVGSLIVAVILVMWK